MLTHPWRNRTGHLESSTEHTVDESTGQLIIGNTAAYAQVIEFGDENRAAYPWMGPACIRAEGRRR